MKENFPCQSWASTYIGTYMHMQPYLYVYSHTGNHLLSHAFKCAHVYKEEKKEMRYKAIKTKKWRDIKSIK